MCEQIFRHEGARGFYQGLSASLVRQVTYSTIRFGLYEELKQHISPHAGTIGLITLASCSGFVGGLAGNLADVVNVRMQNDAALPEVQRKNYRHVFDGMRQIIHEEGWQGCLKGWVPNCIRASAQSAGQLAAYDVFKQVLIQYAGMENGIQVQLTASFIAGLVATTVTNPIDVIKTRVMSSLANHQVVAIIRQSFRDDGIRWMLRGWLPSFSRIGP